MGSVETKMRFEKNYHGVNTVLEGGELQGLLGQFQRYDMEEVKRRFETEDPLLAIRMTSYKVYADTHPDFVINLEDINQYRTLGARKAHLLFSAVLYLTMKCTYPTLSYGNFFDVEPLMDTEGMALIAPGGYFHSLSQTISLQDILRSAQGSQSGPKPETGPADPFLN